MPLLRRDWFNDSRRNRPGDLANAAPPTRSQRLAQAQSDKAVTSAKVSAAQIAQRTFEAIRERRFYICSHPDAMAPVQARFEAIMGGRTPGDPFAGTGVTGAREKLIEALRG